MKLLFDQNLSFRLVGRLADMFPGSSHVRSEGLSEMSDRQIWNFAILRDFVIVTKDNDFEKLAVLFGTPPKVIWLNVGNCTTTLAEEMLRQAAEKIHAFEQDKEAAMLVIGHPPHR